jgi:hypothetical protein
MIFMGSHVLIFKEPLGTTLVTNMHPVINTMMITSSSTLATTLAEKKVAVVMLPILKARFLSATTLVTDPIHATLALETLVMAAVMQVKPATKTMETLRMDSGRLCVIFILHISKSFLQYCILVPT